MIEDDGGAWRPEGVSGIVLAGGASRRFGSDKLEAVLEGRSLLGRAVDAVAAVCSEVIVVVAPGDERSLPDHGDVPIRRAVDPEPHGGPLVGLLAGLEAAQQPIVVVAGGDMPTLSVDVLVAMVRVLLATEGSTDAAILVRQRRGPATAGRDPERRGDPGRAPTARRGRAQPPGAVRDPPRRAVSRRSSGAASTRPATRCATSTARATSRADSRESGNARRSAGASVGGRIRELGISSGTGSR